MQMQRVLYMTGGEGENSYTTNSEVQKVAISKAKSFVEDTVIDLYCKTLPKCLTIVDLGSSSGPNSLLVISEIFDTIHSMCQKLGHNSPEYQVFLNDLPANDFNTIFKSIPSFLQKHKKEKGDGFGPCFISGTPGSFYGRLFPSETINFVHSSYSLQILSQIPSVGESNKGNMYISTTSPPSVFSAYLTQFQRDWNFFLSCRSQEVVAGGRMVLTIIGRRRPEPYSKECGHTLELLSQSLRDMVSEGLVEEAKLDSFNWPAYFPCPEEVNTIIEEQGSFHLDLLEPFDLNWDANNDAKIVSKRLRAVTESMIASHFGEEIIEDLFHRYTEHVGAYLLKEEGKFVCLVMCMTKKG